ncbi:hypothetical protein ACRBEV_09905 [Methylobacterium phyllosphaerae]
MKVVIMSAVPFQIGTRLPVTGVSMTLVAAETVEVGTGTPVVRVKRP